jgi:hypothetical protein
MNKGDASSKSKCDICASTLNILLHLKTVKREFAVVDAGSITFPFGKDMLPFS